MNGKAMKILNEELKRRYEEKRSSKIASWTNWIVKIILLVVALMIISFLTDIHIPFFTDLLRSPNVEEIDDIQVR